MKKWWSARSGREKGMVISLIILLLLIMLNFKSFVKRLKERGLIIYQTEQEK